MKKLYLPITIGFWLVWFSAHETTAQQIEYTQYYLNLAGVNPAFSGMEDYVDLKMAYRQGWNGFGVKNNNLFVSVNAAPGASSPAYISKNGLRISNVDALEQLQSNKRVNRRQGIGAMVTSRTVGPYTSVTINGNYAYHLPVTSKLNVSLGTRVAYGSDRVDFNGYSLRDPVNDAFYQELMQSTPGNQNWASLDFGTALYSNRFYLAFSTTNLGNKSLSGDRLLNFSSARQFSLQTAADLPLGPFLSLNTGVKLTQTEGYELMWAVNSRLRIKELLYVGAGYNSGSRMSFLGGICVNGNFSVNYAYDHYAAGVGALNVNVHEVVLGLAVLNKFDCKSRLW